MPLALAVDGLTISPLTDDDVPAFVAYRQDPGVARWQSWDVTYSRADAERLVAEQPPDLPGPGEWLQLAVRRDGQTIGDVAVHRLADQPDTFEIGVTFARASQGRGFATAAAAAIVGYLFEQAGAHRVVASCDTRNAPVRGLLGRLHFRQESHQPESDWHKGEWTTVDGFALLDREFSSSKE